jgi:hypothetical protein
MLVLARADGPLFQVVPDEVYLVTTSTSPWQVWFIRVNTPILFSTYQIRASAPGTPIRNHFLSRLAFRVTANPRTIRFGRGFQAP